MASHAAGAGYLSRKPRLPLGAIVPCTSSRLPGLTRMDSEEGKPSKVQRWTEEEEEETNTSSTGSTWLCSGQHETCTLIFQLFEIYNFV